MGIPGPAFRSLELPSGIQLASLGDWLADKDAGMDSSRLASALLAVLVEERSGNRMPLLA